jgi:predicted nuclease of restriction endonuclease-like (RecB) superfamily
MSKDPAKRKSSNLTRRERPIVKPPHTGLPSGYAKFLEDLKSRIRTAQIKAALSVNRELIQLYWSIGRDIVERQRAKSWGAAVIDRLAADIQREFPGLAGFSRGNIYRMRAFYLAYPQTPTNVAQAARQIEREIVSQSARQVDAGAPPEPIVSLPWFHNVVLLESLKDPTERLWYASQAVEHGWSRAVLVHWIESDLYSRQGKAVTNFPAVLPPAQSDLAAEIIKDPYNFDFLTLAPDAAERELELALLDHIRQFLLELGAGFAFVGQQMHLEVGGDDFFIDLLFYHLRLRCFIVIDLKTRPFKPEDAGKMNFYLSAVDDRLRHPDDRPSIGLILCKTRNTIIAEYALRDVAKPIGVARYVTRIVEKLPGELKGVLPAPSDIEAELRKSARRRPSATEDTENRE